MDPVTLFANLCIGALIILLVAYIIIYIQYLGRDVDE